jgi:hypothetical protein
MAEDIVELQGDLERHYRALMETRNGPLYALEHGRSREELEGTVSAASPHGVRLGWLVVVAWAAELGFSHVQNLENSFWVNFHIGPLIDVTAQTLVGWFKRFKEDFRGVAPPDGSFSNSFPNIAWPLVHGVVPLSVRSRLVAVVRQHGDLLQNALAAGEPLPTLLSELGDPDNLTYTSFVRTERLAELVTALLLDEPLDEPEWLSADVVERLSGELNEARDVLRPSPPTANASPLTVEVAPHWRGGTWNLRVRLSGHEPLWQGVCGLGALRRLELFLGHARLGTADVVFARGFWLAPTAIPRLVDGASSGLHVQRTLPNDPALDDLVGRLAATSLPLRRRLWLVERAQGLPPVAHPAASAVRGAEVLQYSLIPPAEATAWRRVGELPLWHAEQAPSDLGNARPARQRGRCWVLGVPGDSRSALTTFSDRETVVGVDLSDHLVGRAALHQSSMGRTDEICPLEPTSGIAMVTFGQLQEGTTWLQLHVAGRAAGPKVPLQCIPPPRLTPTAVFVSADAPPYWTVGDLWRQGLPSVVVHAGVPVEVRLLLKCERPARDRKRGAQIKLSVEVAPPVTDITRNLKKIVHAPQARRLCEDSASIRFSAAWGISNLFSTVLEQEDALAFVEREGRVEVRVYGQDVTHVCACYWTEDLPWQGTAFPQDGAVSVGSLRLARLTGSGEPTPFWYRQPVDGTTGDANTLPSFDSLPNVETFTIATSAWLASQEGATQAWEAYARKMRAHCTRATVFRLTETAWDEDVARAWDPAEVSMLNADVVRELRIALRRVHRLTEMGAGQIARGLINGMKQLVVGYPEPGPVGDGDWARAFHLSDDLSTKLYECFADRNMVSQEVIRGALWCLSVRPELKGNPGDASRVAGQDQSLRRWMDKPMAKDPRHATGLIIARALAILAAQQRWRPAGRRLHPLG